MADPIRLVVLKKLTEHLAGIASVDGYNYDLEGSVFRGRTIFGEDDPLPMLSILEAPRAEGSLYGGDYEVKRDKWQLLIQGWSEDDAENPTDNAYLLADDVEKRLGMIIAMRNDNSGRPLHGPTIYKLGNSIVDLEFGPSIIRPPIEQVSSKAFFYLPVTLSLASVVG